MSVLRVIWMSTHGCFAISFPHTRLLFSDDGAQKQKVPEAPFTTLRSTSTMSSSEAPKQEALPLSIRVVVCFRLLKAACLTLCLYSDTVVSADACMTSRFCIRALEAPGL
jgi:hypothetical protein